MQRFWKLVSVTFIAVVAVMVTFLAAAAAQAESRQGATTTHVQQVDTQAEPLSVGQCTGYLSGSGYTVTATRLAACVAGSIPTPTGIPVCTGMLLAIGVRFTADHRGPGPCPHLNRPALPHQLHLPAPGSGGVTRPRCPPALSEDATSATTNRLNRTNLFFMANPFPEP
jgi:hypothetical protein